MLASQLLQHEFITDHIPHEGKIIKRICNVIKEMQEAKSTQVHREILTLTQQLIQVPVATPKNSKKSRSSKFPVRFHDKDKKSF